MHCFRYKLDHDYGLAPNPFGGVITLAVCKGDIRRNKNLDVGDWIIGTGSKKLKLLNHIIYAMRVEGKMTFDEYWNSPDFEFKRPVLNGSLVQMYGDNIYHTDQETGEIIQEPCAHSKDDNSANEDHLKRDWKGQFVLYSHHFYYFGDNCPLIPKELRHICCSYRNYSFKDVDDDFIKKFIDWLENNYTIGIHGDPINWRQYNLSKLNIYNDGIQ